MADASKRNENSPRGIGGYLSLFKAAASEWSEDKVPRLGAALAFYCVLSLAPLLLIAIAIAGLFFGDEAAQGQIVSQLGGLVGEEGGKAIEEMIKNARKPSEGVLAGLIGLMTLLFGASGIFGQLQDALNTIWGVRAKPGQGVLKFIKDRFLSFGMVLVFGFLLLVSLVLSAGLHALETYSSSLLPGSETLLAVVNYSVSLVVIGTLFSTIIKYMPDVEIKWRDVWIGGVMTAVLFEIGKLVIGMYLGKASVGSTYGAAGSFVVLLMWVYYSSQIILFGAEFTQVYANRFGEQIKPSPNAEFVPVEQREKQSMKANTKRG